MKQVIRALSWATRILWVIAIVFPITVLHSGFMLSLHGGVDLGEPQVHTLNGEIVLSIPLSINNKGYYDIRDLRFTGLIKDWEGEVVLNSTTFVPLIDKGEYVNETLRVPISLSEIFSGNRTYLLLQDGQLEALVDVTVTYARAITLQLSVNSSIPWGAPLYQLSLESPHPSFNGTHYFLETSLYFENHSPMSLTGLMHIEAYNARGEILGTTTTRVDAASESMFRQPIQIVLEDPSKLTEKGYIHIYIEYPPFKLGPVVITYG